MRRENVTTEFHLHICTKYTIYSKSVHNLSNNVKAVMGKYFGV